jgi:hypothetical protein
VSSERRGRGAALLSAALVLAGSAAVARAEGPPVDAIRFVVMVSHISDEPGPIDARAARLDAELRDQFRYQSLRVVETRTLDLALDQAGSVALPGGNTLSLKPLLRDARGALLAVDLPGVIQVDMRVRSGQLVVLGAQRYQDGKLVISLEPSF